MDKQIEKHELEERAISRESTGAYAYTSISASAVGGVVCAVLGLLFFLNNVLIVLPLAGLALSLMGYSAVRRSPDEVTGGSLARFGMAFSAFVLVGGITWHAWVFATEVREGYERISFRDLKDVPHTRQPYSETAETLDGKKVFLKGYIRPGIRGTNLKDFILVGDFGACCFGGSPKITDVVAVSILGDDRVSYGWGVRKISGTFRLNRKAAQTGEKEVPRVFYQIDADFVD